MSLSPDRRQRGVIAASAGNHALALAHHGPQLGVPVTVVMPTVAPMTKVSASRRTARAATTGATDCPHHARPPGSKLQSVGCQRDHPRRAHRRGQGVGLHG